MRVFLPLIPLVVASIVVSVVLPVCLFAVATSRLIQWVARLPTRPAPLRTRSPSTPAPDFLSLVVLAYLWLLVEIAIVFRRGEHDLAKRDLSCSSPFPARWNPTAPSLTRARRIRRYQQRGVLELAEDPFLLQQGVRIPSCIVSQHRSNEKTRR